MGGGGGGGRERLCNSDFSFLPTLLVSSVKDQSKLSKILLVGGQCLDRVMSSIQIFCQFEIEII